MDIKINDFVMIKKHIYKVTQDDNGGIILRSTINWFNYAKYPDIDTVKKI